MRKYPVAWFYILAFSISWLGMISVVLASRGIAPVAYALLNCVVAIGLITVFGKTNLSRLERVRIKPEIAKALL